MIGIVYSDESEATSFLKTVNKKKAAIGKILHSSLPPPSILRIASPHSRSAYDALTGGIAGYLITGHVQMQVCEARHPSLETCFSFFLWTIRLLRYGDWLYEAVLWTCRELRTCF